MRASSILMALVVLLLWQCSDIKYPEKPDDLIDKQTMVNIFTDAYLSNASKSFNRTILQRAEVDLGSYIYKKYQIDSLQFERSNAYYTANIDEYREMIVLVKQNLDARLAAVDTIIEQNKEAQKTRRDSLRDVAVKLRDSLGLPKDSLDIEGLEKPDHELDTIVNTVKGTLLNDTKNDR
ncbi:MAG: DUF4296 domain-containing protein [Gilvibacter sp.]